MNKILTLMILILFFSGCLEEEPTIFFNSTNSSGTDTTLDSNVQADNSYLRKDHNYSGHIDINGNDDFQTNDANIIDDLNVFGITNLLGTVTIGGLGAGSASIDFCTLVASCRSIILSATAFGVEDDWNPATNNTLTLGTTAFRWNTVNAVNFTSSAQMIFNVGTAADNNFTFRNASAGSSNISVDGNIYDGNHLYVEKTANIHGMLNIDQNIRVPDENDGFMINGKINVGTIITAGTSGATFVTNASIPLGMPLTCLFVLDISGLAQSCSSAIVIGTVWAKVS